MAPTAIPTHHVTGHVGDIPSPPPVVDRYPALLLIEPPPHEDTSVNDDVPPEFDAAVNGEVLPDNDSLIGENIVTGEHHSSDGSKVSDSLIGVDSIVHGVPVICSNDLSLILVHDIQLLVDEELQKYTTPWRGSIHLRVYPMIEVDAKVCPSLDGEPQFVDICDYFGGCIKVLRVNGSDRQFLGFIFLLLNPPH